MRRHLRRLVKRVEHLVRQLASLKHFKNAVRSLWHELLRQVALEHLVEVGSVFLADLVECDALALEFDLIVSVDRDERLQQVASHSFVD